MLEEFKKIRMASLFYLVENPKNKVMQCSLEFSIEKGSVLVTSATSGRPWMTEGHFCQPTTCPINGRPNFKNCKTDRL